MNTKKMAIITAGIMCFCMVGIAVADTSTTGGALSGVLVQQKLTVRQNKFADGATDLHFKVWQAEDCYAVNGWTIAISGFTNSTSVRGNQPDPYDAIDNGQHAVDVVADGATISYGTDVTINIDFWLTSWNTVRIYGLTWTKGTEAIEADDPCFGWTMGYPVVRPSQPTIFTHKLNIYPGNKPLKLTGIKILPSPVDINIHDTNVPFTDPNTIYVSDQNVAPGSSLVIDVNTTGTYTGGNIYFTATIDTNTTLVADHIVVTPPLTVPTASEWGLIAMGLALLTVGVIAIARKKRAVAT